MQPCPQCFALQEAKRMGTVPTTLKGISSMATRQLLAELVAA